MLFYAKYLQGFGNDKWYYCNFSKNFWKSSCVKKSEWMKFLNVIKQKNDAVEV